jgi:DUF1365 family protein
MKFMPAHKSCIYEGMVQHRRFSPVENTFRYTTFMAFLDLDELPSLFDKTWLWSAKRPALAWFRRADYHKPEILNLKEAVLSTVEEKTGSRPSGSVRILTHLRYFGICFNPVSFYYCYEDDGSLATIMAEITNTPWGERHVYCLECKGKAADRQVFSFNKDFHVSPFMPMDCQYDWRFTSPADMLHVFMANERYERKIFDVRLSLKQKSITPSALTILLLRHPIHTVKVIAGIYWQSLRLKMKGSPFYNHPKIPKIPLERS